MLYLNAHTDLLLRSHYVQQRIARHVTSVYIKTNNMRDHGMTFTSNWADSGVANERSHCGGVANEQHLYSLVT